MADEVIDLTSEDEETTASYATMAKRPKICIPLTSPVGSDKAPLLQPEVPQFDLRELVTSSIKTEEEPRPSSRPPRLQPEVPIQISRVTSLAGQSSTSRPPLRVSVAAQQTPTKPVAGPSRFNVKPSIFSLQRHEQSPQTARRISNDARIQTLKKSEQSVNLNAILERTKRIIKEGESKQIKPGPSGNKMDVKIKPKQAKRAKVEVTTKEGQESLDIIQFLEETFRENPNPLPSDFFVMEEKTNWNTRRLKNWFQRRRHKEGEIGSPDSGFLSNGRTNEPPLRTCKDLSTADSNGVNGAAATGEVSHVGTLNIKKFVKDPTERTDVTVIKIDLEKVKEFSMGSFTELLDTSWNIKAQRIVNIVKDKRYGPELKQTALKEARRLKDIASDVSPFSEEQQEAVIEWRKQFLNSLVPDASNSKLRSEVDHIIENYVLPWIQPFMYGRIVQMNGRYLSLLVAINDFCLVSNSASSSDFSWKIPCFLQY